MGDPATAIGNDQPALDRPTDHKVRITTKLRTCNLGRCARMASSRASSI